MFKKLFNKKAFTLIELIVVMAVIGILVLLAMPKFMGYTERARLTEIKSNIRQLENASERYYIKEQSWPRASDTYYSSEQLENFAQEIMNRTGAIVTLDKDGKYYPISYDKLQKYVQKPKDGVHYILQNPVGEVFYLDKLTDEGKDALSTLPTPTPTPEPVYQPNLTKFDLNNYSQLTYVDSINGSDTNDGSDEAPYKTLQKAIDSTSTNGVIYVKKGEYREYSQEEISMSNMNIIDKNLTLVGENQDTKIITNTEGISNTTRKHSLYMHNANVKIYNMVFEYEGVNPGWMHWFGFLTTPQSSGNTSIEVYNCAFIAKTPKNHMHLTMTFETFTKMSFVNCLMDLSQDSDLEGYYYNPQVAFELTNSALLETTPSNCVGDWNTRGMNHAKKTFTNTIHNGFTYDPITYDITSNNTAQRGVYYGPHAWTR